MGANKGIKAMDNNNPINGIKLIIVNSIPKLSEDANKLLKRSNDINIFFNLT